MPGTIQRKINVKRYVLSCNLKYSETKMEQIAAQITETTATTNNMKNNHRHMELMGRRN